MALMETNVMEKPTGMNQGTRQRSATYPKTGCATEATTVLQKIIDAYKAKGYVFETLTVDSPKFQHVKQPESVN